MIFKILSKSSISSVNKNEWDNLINNENPFLKHDFFRALEESKCTSKDTGWEANHFLILKDKKICGIIPTFKKFNSNGEYVFDHSWADAYSRLGLNYYPKLLSGIPFTPINSEKIFIDKSIINSFEVFFPALMNEIKKKNISSFHLNFSEKFQSDALKKLGFHQRIGIQYHWKNNNYNSFDDFLSKFKSKKRKNVLKERKAIQDAKIKITFCRGKDISQSDWEFFYYCYSNTIDKKWSFQYLNFSFFQKILESSLLENILLIIAKDKQNKYVACTLNFIGNKKLYGRYWGCIEEFPYLHFELCYYQSIEYAIKNNINVIEAGAQGEHKISRGYLPTITYSNHWVGNDKMSKAINDFLKQESIIINKNFNYLNKISPFKSKD